MTSSTHQKEIDLPRLTKRREFLRVARQGQKFATPGLVLQAWKANYKERHNLDINSSLEQSSRIGFTVSRKVGNAVNRNRAKRRLRAVASQVMLANALKGTDFVIIGRAETLTRPFRRLVEDLKVALKRLDCYRG